MRRRRGVELLVAIADGGVAVLHGLADESGVGRVFVAFHEGVDVAPVPVCRLLVEELANGGSGVCLRRERASVTVRTSKR